MVFEIILAILCGVLCGIITGLIPGIHVNLVCVLVVSMSMALPFSPLLLCCFIIALAITHSFLDSIPSIYLGAPDPSQVLTVLPGHRMLHQGKGHLAVKMTIIGSLLSLVIGAMCFPLFIKGMAAIYPAVRSSIKYVLIVIMVFMVFREKKWYWALLVFFCAGFLGLLVLEDDSLSQPLFPLLSGLFGISLLLFAADSGLPEQDNSAQSTLPLRTLGKAGIVSTSMGFIAAFLPGFGSSQAAILAQQISGKMGDEGFLALVGGINTSNMLISIVTAYALSKARNGAIVSVLELIGEVGFNQMLIFLGVCLTAGGIAAMLAIVLSRSVLRLVSYFDYKKTVFSIIVFITLLVIGFDGFRGLIVLVTATALGAFAGLSGIGKNHLMGCLIVPVIVYLW